jgi:hypothetical protein
MTMARTGLCRRCGETHDDECEPRRKPKPRVPVPSIGIHMASLNLFREADGTFEITVAGTSPEFRKEWEDEVKAPPEPYETPMHKLERAIIAAAERMKSRHAGIKPG